MEIHRFMIKGMYRGKQRPRMSTNKKTGREYAYTPKTTKEYEKLIQASYIESRKGKELNFIKDSPFYIIVEAYRTPLTRLTKKEKEMCLNGEIENTTKPDEDNIKKIVNDALNGLAYDDDSQIINSVTDKDWSKEDYSYVVVTLTKSDKKPVPPPKEKNND